MTTVEEGLRSQLRNIETAHGRSIEDDHGSSKAFAVTMQHRSSDGVLLPDQRIVEVQAVTGEVVAFLDLRRSFDPPAAARIGQDAAETAARTASGLPVVLAADLAVTFGASGNQLLAWRIELRDLPVAGRPISAAIVMIDAATGDVLPNVVQP